MPMDDFHPSDFDSPMSNLNFAPRDALELLQDVPCLVGDTVLLGYCLPNSVQAGFPSPAEDLGGKRIDLGQLLVTHPQATYFLRASGRSMEDAGIRDQDILVVDKAIKPRHGHIVVAIVDGDFTVKQLFQRAGHIKLKAANPTYPDITPKDGQTVEVWGVVTATVRQMVT
jgi:DNA polymerase V